MFKDGPNKSGLKSNGLAPTNVPRKLSHRDVALGIGRKATEEELEEYLSRPYGKSVPLDMAISKIKKQLIKKAGEKRKWK